MATAPPTETDVVHMQQDIWLMNTQQKLVKPKMLNTALIGLIILAGGNQQDW